MSDKNGKIRDVYKVLGISPKDGVYDVGYACSNKHEKINRFSFKKPMRIGVITTNSDSQFEFNHCGLKAVEALIPGTPPTLVCEPWGYDAPTGGPSSPYRLADFYGYNHNAVAPIRLQETEITYDKSSDINNLIVQANFTVKDGNETISYGDTANVEISLDQLVTNEPRLTWWGLAYINGNEILVANSDNNLDQSDKGYEYSPGVVKLGDWKLGEYLKGRSAGSTVQLVPIINTRPNGGGRPDGIDKNGGLSAEPLCFPDGQFLTIKIIESPTGIFAQATWSLSGSITVYNRSGEIGHFGIGGDAGAVEGLIGGAASQTVTLELGIIVSPKNGAFTITAENWVLDFGQFPHDPNYYIAESGQVRCTGVTTTKGGTGSASMSVSTSTIVYFKGEVSANDFMRAFYEQKSYRGIVSLRNTSSSQTAASDVYQIPSTNASNQ